MIGEKQRIKLQFGSDKEGLGSGSEHLFRGSDYPHRDKIKILERGEDVGNRFYVTIKSGSAKMSINLVSPTSFIRYEFLIYFSREGREANSVFSLPQLKRNVWVEAY